jgi:cytochrome b pre-mRNA-processing protein 3
MLAIPKNKLFETGIYLYEACTDHVPVERFFKEFELPDTYYGWFLVTELHVWLLMSRVMSEGPEGRFLRNQLVEAMWADSTERLKHLAKIGTKEKQASLDELMEHFQACILSYDEGLLGSDKVLAGALWRILFTYDCKDFRYLETMVRYIRHQNEHLQLLTTEDILLKPLEFRWAHFAPFHPIKQ